MTIDLEVPMEGARRLVASSRWLWVALANGEVAQLDPLTGRERGRILASERPNDIAATEEGAWVVDDLDGIVSRIGTSLYLDVQSIRVGPDLDWIVADDRGAWVTGCRKAGMEDPAPTLVSCRMELRRVDAATSGVTVRVPLVRHLPTFIPPEIDMQADGQGGVWISMGSEWCRRSDLDATCEGGVLFHVMEDGAVGTPIDLDGPGGFIEEVGGELWVGNPITRSIDRILP